MTEILTNFLHIPQQWSSDTPLPTNPLSDEIWGFISEWSQRNMTKFHIIYSLPEWISLVYANTSLLIIFLIIYHYRLGHIYSVWTGFIGFDAVANCEIQQDYSVKEKKE